MISYELGTKGELGELAVDPEPQFTKKEKEEIYKNRLEPNSLNSLQARKRGVR